MKSKLEYEHPIRKYRIYCPIGKDEYISKPNI